MWTTGDVVRVGRAPHERLQAARALADVAHERDADDVRPRFDAHTRFQPRVDRVRCVRRIREHRGRIRRAADGVEEDALAVDGHFDLMRKFRTADRVQVGAEQLDLQDVLGVERKGVADLHAADGAERKTVDVLILREILARTIGLAARRNAGLADGQRAHAARGRQVSLEQGRRDAEDVGDVVEAVARIVGRQERGGVDLERQQVSDRVGVLRAVQTMQQRPAGIRRGCRRGVEARFEPRA